MEKNYQKTCCVLPRGHEICVRVWVHFAICLAASTWVGTKYDSISIVRVFATNVKHNEALGYVITMMSHSYHLKCLASAYHSLGAKLETNIQGQTAQWNVVLWIKQWQQSGL